MPTALRWRFCGPVELVHEANAELYSADGWVYNYKKTEIELSFLNSVVGDQKGYKTGRFFDPKHFGRQSWHGW